MFFKALCAAVLDPQSLFYSVFPHQSGSSQSQRFGELSTNFTLTFKTLKSPSLGVTGAPRLSEILALNGAGEFQYHGDCGCSRLIETVVAL